MINGLVERVRKMLDAEGANRGRRLVLAARVLSGLQNAAMPVSIRWLRAKAGWIDFLTISIYSGSHPRMSDRGRSRSPACRFTAVPIRPGPPRVTATLPGRVLQLMEPMAIYLFNFFTPREVFVEPPFEVLKDLGDDQKTTP